MACVELDFKDIFPVIKHHIALIERYEDKYHRDFSLIFIKSNKNLSEDIAKTLSRILRNSDIIFKSKKNIVVFSPGADWNVAYDIARGIKEFYAIDDKKDAIVTYPDDGPNALLLLEKFAQSIHQNYDIMVNFIKN